MGKLNTILDSHWMESMSSRSPLSATNDQKSALAELAGSELRGEADRGRAILLAPAGWTGPEIAEAFGVTAEFGAPLPAMVR